MIHWVSILVIVSVAAQQQQQYQANQQQPAAGHHQQPVAGHHQQPVAGQHQQPAAAHQVPPAQQQQQFGGDAAHDSVHIKEHLDGKIDPTANMTPEQLQFHYFNMHDLDKNGKLDGIELIKAITHFHNENPAPGHEGNQPPLPSEVELEQMIDSILRDDDFNGDGFIDYGEFLKAQKMREDAARAHQAQMAQGGQTPPPPQH